MFVGVRVPEEEGVVRYYVFDVLWVKVRCVCRVERVPEDEGVVRCSLCDVLWVQVSCVCRVVRAPKG